ncbi:unnamed protein product [Phytomonas sp. EM1]|nr:unnamed protein product [Phytomonas sp. EM1]|eukprot:CCW64666.1 unnamed protein product [Phytomonas sp. isolate EM1]
MIFLLVDGDYFLTGFMPNTDAEVKEAVERLEASLVNLICKGDVAASKEGAAVSFDVRVMFFSSAFFNSLEERQRKIVTSATRRVRFQITVLESVRGRTGSPVDAALCTKAIILAMMPKHGEAATRDSAITSGQIFCFVTPNAYIASALGVITSRGCDALFAIYEGDEIAEELFGYISASYGTGIAMMEKREGISFIPNTEAASAVLAALQREGKELPLAVVVQLKRLQDSLIDNPATNGDAGATQEATEGKSQHKVTEELSFFSPPPLQGLPDPFASEQANNEAPASHNNTPPPGSDAAPNKGSAPPEESSGSQASPPNAGSLEDGNRPPATTPPVDAGGGLPFASTAPRPMVSTELPPGWVLQFDPSRQRHYYVHTDSQNNTQLSWQHPLGHEKQAELERNVAALYLAQAGVGTGMPPAANYNPATHANSTNDNTSLPPNWDQRIDPRTGCVYYVNHSTRQTTWTRPQNPVVGTVHPNPQQQPAMYPTCGQDKWEPHVDPKTGRIFYVNHATRQTSWTKPGVPFQTLPPNWEARVDPQTGRTFYVNHETKETTWDAPSAQLWI